MREKQKKFLKDARAKYDNGKNLENLIFFGMPKNRPDHQALRRVRTIYI